MASGDGRSLWVKQAKLDWALEHAALCTDCSKVCCHWAVGRWPVGTARLAAGSDRLVKITSLLVGSRHSPVGIATRYGLDDPGIESRGG